MNFKRCIAYLILSFICLSKVQGQTNLMAQPQGGLNQGLNNGFSDSTGLDSMRSDWVDEQAEIYAQHLHSDLKIYPDTSIATFHRYQSHQPWWGTHLGNYGTAAQNAFFTPNQKIGLQLGYDAYDLYKFTLDSLKYYNTTKPYSAFSFLSGSQNQQHVEILHTQNISPSWNFSTKLRNMSSEGFYAQQKANVFSANVSSNYSSANDRYKVHFGIIYNKFKQDENGGIVSDSFLNLQNFQDRRRIPVNLPLSSQSRGNTSAVKNTNNDFDFFIMNDYSWGKADTTYNEDSTSATYSFIPRFSLQHELRIHSEKHEYYDNNPDSLRYDFIAPLTLNRTDSIVGVQSLFYVDNRFSLNGYLGKLSNSLLHLKAGLGNRIDQFSESYLNGKSSMNSIGNYVFGNLKKEALEPRQWAYEAEAQFYFSGKALGNFHFKAALGKDLGKWGQLAAGLSQSLSNAPLSYESLKTNFYTVENSLNKMSVSSFWGKIYIPEIELEVGINNHLINNYLYFDETGFTNQYSNPISILQVYGRKKLQLRIFSLDNEVVWQQPTLDAPVNLPAFMIREQFKVESYIFKNALQVAVGIEARYLSAYYSDGYNPYFNQYFLQNDYKRSNFPELSAFFNFKIKSFRAFVLGNQLQQLFSTNAIYAKGYPYPNSLFQFGFTWVLIN